MFCMKCGNEIPEWAKFCIKCGNPVPEDLISKNPQESSAAENPAVENPAPERAAAENPAPERAAAENPAPVTAAVENPAVSENPTQENSAAPQEKSATVKAVIGEMGKKLESAKPMIDKMGEKLESAKPMIGEMGKKLESAKPVVGKIGEKLKIKPDRKKLPVMIGAVVLILAVIMLLRSCAKGPGSGFGSPEEAFDAWMTGFCQQDFDLALRAEPDFVIKYEGGEDRLKETLQRNYNNDVAPLAAKGFVKFEATGHVMLGEEETKELEQRMENVYGVDIKLSAAARINHRSVTTDGNGTTGISGYAFKYKGKWHYLNIE